jgi:hypothetical protein
VAIDYTSAVGQVRILIADVSDDADEQLLDDEQITALLTINSDHVRRAAADALDAIATSEVLVSKKIRTQDLQTDGPAVAASLQARAKQLRDQAEREDADFVFDVVYDEPDTDWCDPLGGPFNVWGL